MAWNFSDAVLHSLPLLTNLLGPCIGQWQRTDGVSKGDANAIFTSYNRNFRGRNDGNPETMNFLASPEIVTAMSYAGSTSFNPITDSITTPSGQEFRFSPPTGAELPTSGFEEGNPAFLPTSAAPSPSGTCFNFPSSLPTAVSFRGLCTSENLLLSALQQSLPQEEDVGRTVPVSWSRQERFSC